MLSGHETAYIIPQNTMPVNYHVTDKEKGMFVMPLKCICNNKTVIGCYPLVSCSNSQVYNYTVHWSGHAPLTRL